MKTLILISCLLFCGCVGNSSDESYVSNGKRVYPKYRALYQNYIDSTTKYSRLIHTKCGRELYWYYAGKVDSAYKAIYPEGNPCCDDEKQYDTVCYPIKQ